MMDAHSHNHGNQWTMGPIFLQPGLTIPETKIASENGWLEDDPFLLGWLSGRCELLVLGGVYSY